MLAKAGITGPQEVKVVAYDNFVSGIRMDEIRSYNPILAVETSLQRERQGQLTLPIGPGFPPDQHRGKRAHLHCLALRPVARFICSRKKLDLGIFPGHPARHAMKFFNHRLLTVLPYLGMAAALGLSAWTFIQSNRYRQETDAILNQTFEIQWRAAQIRERLIRVYGYLRIADETGKLDADIARQMALVSVNVAQLENLPYLKRFFPDHDAELLGRIRLTLEQKIPPHRFLCSP
ncbi:hypothetical protein [Mesorhizobium sp. M0254]|uniref:hypothetical protein n=1 Tax=Mesorhizobium sp. M0254 TaxID=2956927 RepID=UPI00333C558E